VFFWGSTDIRQNLETFLVVSIGAGRSCMKKKREKKSCDTVPLRNFSANKDSTLSLIYKALALKDFL
jgi:hypothetical protein